MNPTSACSRRSPGRSGSIPSPIPRSLAVHGTSWLAFGRRVRVTVGEPLEAAGRPSRAAVDELTERCRSALVELVRDEPERTPPGRIGRWLTEAFNDWPEGSRVAAEVAGDAAVEAAGDTLPRVTKPEPLPPA